MFFVYVLYSERLTKYYVGSTEDIDKRLFAHNTGKAKFTSGGIPWRLVHRESFFSRSEAIIDERRIKKRGIKRYLQDRGVL
jgi:putative endonuclease